MIGARWVRGGCAVQLLRGVVPQEECRRFLWQAVEPALRAKGVLYDDERTWGGKYGDVITAPDGGDHPIPQSSPDSRWPALFQSDRLRKVRRRDNARRSPVTRARPPRDTRAALP